MFAFPEYAVQADVTLIPPLMTGFSEAYAVYTIGAVAVPELFAPNVTVVSR